MKYIIFLIIAALLLIGAYYLKPSEGDQNKMPEQTANINDMKIEDIKVGTGAEAAVDKTITVHYVGTFDDGTTFDSSRERGEPATFELSRGRLINGWILGIPGMKIGGVRKLTIPPELGYGAQDVTDPRTGAVVIPANSTLHFEVELLDVK